MKTSISTVWNQLWVSHYQVKKLLLFSFPTKSSKGTVSTVNKKENNNNNNEKPPGYSTHQKVGLAYCLDHFFLHS